MPRTKYKTEADIVAQLQRISDMDRARGNLYSNRQSLANGIARRYMENMDALRGGGVSKKSKEYIRRTPELRKKYEDGIRKAEKERQTAEDKALEKLVSSGKSNYRSASRAGEKAYQKALQKYVTPIVKKAEAEVDTPYSREEYTNMEWGDLGRQATYGRPVSRYMDIPFSDSRDSQANADAYMARMGNKSAQRMDSVRSNVRNIAAKGSITG